MFTMSTGCCIGFNYLGTFRLFLGVQCRSATLAGIHPDSATITKADGFPMELAPVEESFSVGGFEAVNARGISGHVSSSFAIR